MKQFVSTYDNTIKVRMQAIRSDSSSVLPDFSPSALAQMRQNLVIPFAIEHTIEKQVHFPIVDHTMKRTVWNEHNISTYDGKRF